MLGIWGGVGGFCFHLCKRKRKRCAQCALLEAQKKNGKILHDYTAAINKLLEIWTCWVYGVGWGDFVSTFANANANAARSARCWRQKKDEKQTKQNEKILHDYT